MTSRSGLPTQHAAALWLLAATVIDTGLARTLSADELPACSADPTLSAYAGYEPCPSGMQLVIDERFDQFDAKLWERSTGGFPENACRYRDSNTAVAVNDGKLVLTMRAQQVPASYSRHELKVVDEKQCASGELRSRDEFGPYGRLEARLRTPRSSGFIQSLFWFHFYKDPWQELDIELQGRLPDSVSTNIITNHAKSYKECDLYRCTANSENHVKLPFRHSEGWHVYTIDWYPDRASFYVDGVKVRESLRRDINSRGGNFPDLASTILMNFWLPDRSIAAGFGGKWSLDQLPLHAEYDWVRYYQLQQQ